MAAPAGRHQHHAALPNPALHPATTLTTRPPLEPGPCESAGSSGAPVHGDSYGARAPIANTRLHRDADGQLVVTLRKPLRDGRTQLRFAPIDFLRRLATLIPPPRKNLTRYDGVFAPNHHLRADVVAYGRPDVQARPKAPSGPAPRRINWADLLRRVFAIDVLRCVRCDNPMRILAVLREGDATRAILEHLRLPIEPPAPRSFDPPSRC